MKIRFFLDEVEHDKVHRAIQAAEAGTSARFVIYIGHGLAPEPLEAAHRVFSKLHLEGSREKPALLLFVAPRSRKFAVLGGHALHQKLGQAWWNRLAGLIGAHFKEERYTAGLLAAIAAADEAFHQHFSSSEPRPVQEKDIYNG